MAPTTDRIRNVALVGHNGNGKTSLAEALLFRAGVRQRMGDVEAGTTASDTDEEEQRRTQSLSLSVLPFGWNDHHVNLIDTPGYADFMGEALAAVRVADLLVFVIDAVAGVQTQDELLWRAAAEQNKPRLIFVNKMDREPRQLRPHARPDPRALQPRRHRTGRTPHRRGDRLPRRRRPHHRARLAVRLGHRAGERRAPRRRRRP